MADTNRPKKHVIVDLGDPDAMPMARYSAFAKEYRPGRLNWQPGTYSIDDSECFCEDVLEALASGDVATLKFRCAVPTGRVDDFLCPHLRYPEEDKDGDSDDDDDSDNDDDDERDDEVDSLRLRRIRQLRRGFQQVLCLAEKLINTLPDGTLSGFR